MAQKRLSMESAAMRASTLGQENHNIICKRMWNLVGLCTNLTNQTSTNPKRQPQNNNKKIRKHGFLVEQIKKFETREWFEVRSRSEKGTKVKKGTTKCARKTPTKIWVLGDILRVKKRTGI